MKEDVLQGTSSFVLSTFLKDYISLWISTILGEPEADGGLSAIFRIDIQLTTEGVNNCSAQ